VDVSDRTDGDPARLAADELALDFLGMTPNEADSVEWWICTRCDNAGVMGAPTFG
jgi:hypothetical protein